MFHTPNKYRVTKGPYATPFSYGNAGMFKIPHYKIDHYTFVAMVGDMSGWEHVSISIVSNKMEVKRCPTWEEMCWLKDIFWDEDDCVMQLHPPKSEHVSTHNYCLHMWRPIGVEIPLPHGLMVGLKNVSHEMIDDYYANQEKKL